MATQDAPATYIAVNLSSLAIALLAARWLPVRTGERHALGLGIALLGLLGLTLFVGHDLDGIRRWLALGPLNLHIGYLVLPSLVVLMARLHASFTLGLLVTAMAICTFQPDRAAVLALASAAAARAIQHRDRFAIAALVAAATALRIVWSIPDPLAPVPFVEGVLQDAWAASEATGTTLLLANLAPLVLFKAIGRDALPFVAFEITANCAALLGNYPSILIGYGAAPILGLGLALAALRRQ